MFLLNLLSLVAAVWTHPEFPVNHRIHKRASADVIIIGSGLSGLTAASVLTAAGKSVLVLEG